MPPPQRPREPSGVSSLEWGSLEWVLTDDGSRTLFDSRLNETFHSGCGAVAETLIVYVHHSGMLERFRQRQPSTLVEFGLGTATGFLLTSALAEVYQTPLSYHAFEISLLPSPLFRQLELTSAIESCLSRGLAKPLHGIDPGLHLEEFERLPHLMDAFCDALSRLFDSAEQFTEHEPICLQLSEFVQLHLWLSDIRKMPQQALERIPHSGCDAVYFDPFSPQTNPELWTANVFQQAYNFLRPGGTLTSYCVKSSVRRELAACGFQVHKVAGPVGGKREVLLAVK